MPVHGRIVKHNGTGGKPLNMLGKMNMVKVKGNGKANKEHQIHIFIINSQHTVTISMDRNGKTYE